MNTISEYIEYFENLIEGFTHEDYCNLRNRPEVLDEIKGFYNLCFEKMAEGLNELVYQTTGEATTIFNQPVKLADVQFHFNKLGEMSAEANTFEEMALGIGGAIDVSTLDLEMSHRDISGLIPITREVGVYEFIFPDLKLRMAALIRLKTIIAEFRSLFVSGRALSNLEFGKSYIEVISKAHVDGFYCSDSDYIFFPIGYINQDRMVDNFKKPTPAKLTFFFEVLATLISLVRKTLLPEYFVHKSSVMTPELRNEGVEISFSPLTSKLNRHKGSYLLSFVFSGYNLKVSKVEFKLDIFDESDHMCLVPHVEGCITIDIDTILNES